MVACGTSGRVLLHSAVPSANTASTCFPCSDIMLLPVPVVERSKARGYGRSLDGIAPSNPAGGMYGCPLWVLCVLSGRGLCDGLIARPEESYRLCCVLVCDLGTSRMRRLKLIKGCKCRIEEEEEDIMLLPYFSPPGICCSRTSIRPLPSPHPLQFISY
jgi:hypothetical protein